MDRALACAGMALAALALAGCPSSRPTNPPKHALPAFTPTPPPEIEAADSLHRAGNPIGAVEAYSAYAQAHPSDPLPWTRIGETLLQNHQYGDAIEALTEAKNRDPKPGRTDGLLAQAVLGVGRADDALRMAEALRRDAPTEPLALVVLADIARRQGRFAQQLGYLEEWTKLKPDSPEAWLALGRAQFATQQREPLGRTGDIVIYLAPQYAEGWLWRAFWTYYLGPDSALPGGIDAARHAIKIAPNSYHAQLTLGRLLRRQRAWKDAIPVLERAARLQPDRFDAYPDLAVCYERAGRAADSQRARAAFQRGQARMTALEALSRRARAHPDDVSVQLAAHAEALTLGDLQTALESLRRAASAAPDDPRVRKATQAWSERQP